MPALQLCKALLFSTTFLFGLEAGLLTQPLGLLQGSLVFIVLDGSLKSFLRRLLFLLEKLDIIVRVRNRFKQGLVLFFSFPGCLAVTLELFPDSIADTRVTLDIACRSR